MAVTLLQDFKADDLARLLEHSDSKMLIVGPYVWRDLQHQQLPELQSIMSMDDFSFIHLAEEYKGNVEHIMTEPSTLTENTFFSLVQDGEIDLDSLALINYTSALKAITATAMRSAITSFLKKPHSIRCRPKENCLPSKPLPAVSWGASSLWRLMGP